MSQTTKRRRPAGAGVWKRVGTPETGFTYLRADGKALRLPSAVARIRALAIPPAWTGVEIAADPKAKVQATGIDAAGRKQYRYHPDATDRRSRRKFRKLLEFARVLPRIREATDLHLRRPGLGREKVLATVVRLIMRGFFRVGSERYAVENKTFGIATLRKRHLRIDGNDLRFRYVGKKSIHQHHVVADTPLVEVLREIVALPGRRLFRWVDEAGGLHDVTAADVNAYVKSVAGEKYTSKDIRTWGGTVRAATILADLGPPASAAEAKRNVVLACKLVSAELGNTPSVCRSAYVHPVVLEKYQAGKTIAPFMREASRPAQAGTPAQYYPEEAALMRFLERWG
ncbi:MAG: topoisomerase catalytic core domain protein [Gemmatimonadetes bacterium]|nr:topoisomerase catalytic core domain protein [Gemmatimonadota bacterium]